MSANAPSEGVVAPDATASSLGGNADNVTAEAPQTQDAIWGRLSNPETPAEAAPAPDQATPESATPTPEVPTEQKEEEGDRLDKLDPVNAKAEDFRELRGHRKELERKLKLVEPVAAKVQALGDPGVLDVITPILQNFTGDDDPALFEAGKSTVGGLLAYDPRIANGLAVGVYEHYKDWLIDQALQESGLTPTDLASFKEWKQTGGAVKTVYAPQGFPVADREGYVILPNGVELNVGKAEDPTSGDPTHKAMYELAKDNWETKERERQRETDSAARTAREAQERETGIVKQRQDAWSNAELTAFEQFVQSNPIKVEDHQEQATMMVMGVLQHLISEDNELAKWADEGRRLAGQGAAKANSLAMNARQRSQDHYKTAHKAVTGIFDELTSLRKIVSGGKVQNAARMPADSIPVERQPDQYTPPPPSQAGSDAYQDIFSRNLANLST